MRILAGIFAIATILSACNGANTSLSTIQMSGATETLPRDYIQMASKAVAALPKTVGSTLVFSEPRTVVGTNPFSPRRWYVCASGIAPPLPKLVSIKPLVSYVEDWVAPPQSYGRYDVIIIFNPQNRMSLLKSYDAVLCD